MTMKVTKMRNRWGVEIKKGYHAWATWGNQHTPIDGVIVQIDRTSDFARAYGAQITLKVGYNHFIVGADAISSVLPPMSVGRGGVVKANPIDDSISGISSTPLNVPAIAARDNGNGRRLWYVEDIPRGKAGAMDWAYTDNFANAIALSPHWQKRFKSNCDLVGVRCHFMSEADARGENPDIHIDINSHNTKGRNVRASNPVTEARELWLYARNLPQFVNAARDAFQRGASAAAWKSIALRAARSYSAEFGDGSSRWRNIFTDDDLSVVATMLRDDMQNEAEDDSLYANPLSRTWPDAPSQRAHAGRGGKPTKRPSARLVERRLKTAAMPMPGVWANPLVRVKVGSKSMASKSPPDSRLRARRRLTDKAPPGFYANPAAALPKNVRTWYEVQAKTADGGVWTHVATAGAKSQAFEIARALADIHPTWALRVISLSDK